MRAYSACWGLFFLLGSAGSFSCSGGEQENDFCEILLACNTPGFTESQCQALFDPLILSDACWKAFEAASCTEHQAENSPYEDLCFPPCEQNSAVCAGATVTICNNNKIAIVDCAKLCESKGLKYSGVCAKEYNGQQSDTGMDTCWCIQ